jgi:hypothetical protein
MEKKETNHAPSSPHALDFSSDPLNKQKRGRQERAEKRGERRE